MLISSRYTKHIRASGKTSRYAYYVLVSFSLPDIPLEIETEDVGRPGVDHRLVPETRQSPAGGYLQAAVHSREKGQSVRALPNEDSEFKLNCVSSAGNRNIWKVVFIAGGCDLISKHGTNIHPNSQGRESDILDIFGMLEDV